MAGRGNPRSFSSRRVLSLRRGLIGLAVLMLSLAGGGTSWGSAAPYNPATDMYSMANVTAQTGAAAWWSAGYTGAGVDVALIDTGVSPVAGLATAGKVVNGPDLSLESQNVAFRYLDTNGHGTFMAGLIAGHDSTLRAPYANAPASAYRGVAPDARIVSLKVGVADGGVDASQVIAAIAWVVQHKTDNGMNIRVINLSYGTNSTQSSTLDPLSYAVEQAWKKGIVVVAAAGNSGYEAEKGLANPAHDPYVIGVGGYDTIGTAVVGDDILGTYSAGIPGGGYKAPDFVAAGSHMQGLRVPGSYIDQSHPEGLIDPRYFRGSGTSEAAAITSGTIALLLQKYPNLTPDQVKRFLGTNTQKPSGTDADYWGSGEINLTVLAAKTPVAYTQKFTNSTGAGSLELTRGTDHVTDDGAVLTGEQDVFGHVFNPSAMAIAEAAGNSWSGGAWNGNSWSGNSWSGNSWSRNSWSGNSWSGNSWSGNSWSGNSWSCGSWS